MMPKCQRERKEEKIHAHCFPQPQSNMNGQVVPRPMLNDGKSAANNFPNPAAQDVPNPSSQPAGAWPHRMVRHALASVATLGLNVSAPSIYSPSGCKYSRLDVDGHRCNDDVGDSFGSPDEANRLHADGQADTAHESGADANHQPQPSQSPSLSHQIAWRTLVIVAAVVVAMNLAYFAGYQSYARMSAFQDDSTSLYQDGNQLYPNNPEHYDMPMPGSGRFKNGRTHPKVFVCITGQLPRLELANKIENLFLPWVQDYDVEFDVALVLTNTNHSSVQRVEERDQSYYSVEQVYAELSALDGVNVLNSNTDVQSQDPILNPHYIQQRAQDTTMTAAKVLERVQNHVRQFESLAECHHHIAKRGTPAEYDVVHRVREDSGYYLPVDFGHIYDVLSAHPMTILSSDCQFHGGINDRGSFVSPAAAFDYFVYPILDMYTRPLPSDIRNTEQFLMVTYAHTCRLVQTDSYQIFRLWQKVDNEQSDNDDGGDDDAIASAREKAVDQHMSKMEFSRSDLRCLEDEGRSNAKHLSNHLVTRRKFCHDYSDGYKYCIFFDKAGVSYYPGKPGLLRDTDDDLPSARINEDWVPPKSNEAGAVDGGSSTFDILDIGWDGSAVDQVDNMLKITTTEHIIDEKRAKRKKKRQDWEENHRAEDDGDDDNKDP